MQTIHCFTQVLTTCKTLVLVVLALQCHFLGFGPSDLLQESEALTLFQEAAVLLPKCNADVHYLDLNQIHSVCYHHLLTASS